MIEVYNEIFARRISITLMDVGDKFCITFMQMNKKKTYMDCFFTILDEEKIPYKLHGVYNNHLPISKVESAPVEE